MVGPKAVLTPSGATVELLGRLGIRYSRDGKSTLVDAEMLAGPRAIAVYPSSVSGVGAAVVLAEVIGALKWLDFEIEIDGVVG